MSSVSFREVICEGRDRACLFAVGSPKFDSRRLHNNPSYLGTVSRFLPTRCPKPA